MASEMYCLDEKVGTNSPADKFEVNGGIRTKDIKVLALVWPE